MKVEGVVWQMEVLNWGFVVVKMDGGIFVSWWFFGIENVFVLFNVYRDG